MPPTIGPDKGFVVPGCYPNDLPGVRHSANDRQGWHPLVRELTPTLIDNGTADTALAPPPWRLGILRQAPFEAYGRHVCSDTYACVEMKLIGTTLVGKGARPCGLCGEVRKPTRSHVPPQTAGNSHSVQRAADVIDETQVRKPGRYTEGGMWVRGLCADCNGRAGRNYDLPYADFAHAVMRFLRMTSRNFWVSSGDVPAVPVAPGLVVRSVLYGMFAVHPRLRLIFPELAGDLVVDRPLPRWPDQVQLRVAVSSGRGCLLSSGVFMASVVGPTAGQQHFTFAEIVFPPFAWALVPTDTGAQVSASWADASEWVRYGPDRNRVDLRDLTRVLPGWKHPRLTVGRNEDWVELHGPDGTDAESVILLGRLT